jgi:hypothetical protein
MPAFRRLAWVVLLGICACSGNNGDGNPTFDARPGDAGAGAADAPLALDGASGADANPNAPDAGGGMVNDAGQALCQGDTGLEVCECSDGVNNDSDAFIDAADPECVGPYDNDESSYATGIPGDNSDPFAQDCFFDGDSGGGNDGCRWDVRCTNPPGGQHCNNTQLNGCDACRPLVPNGCDCFGCCDVYVNGQLEGPVRIIETCTAEVIDDPAKCPPCTKVTACENPCDECEECLGRPAPPTCMPPDGGTGGGQCPVEGTFPCTEPDNTCPAEYRCVTGCCVKFLSAK